MNKNSILTNRLKNLYTIYNNKQVSYYDLYTVRTDLLAKDVESNIYFDGKSWRVTDFGCNFNYLKYIKTMTDKYPSIIGYNDGLVIETK